MYDENTMEYDECIRSKNKTKNANSDVKIETGIRMYKTETKNQGRSARTRAETSATDIGVRESCVTQIREPRSEKKKTTSLGPLKFKTRIVQCL